MTTRDIRPTKWTQIRRFLGGMASAHPKFGYLVEVVDSVINGDRTADLVGYHFDARFDRYAGAGHRPPFDVIAVRAPGSLQSPAQGNVLIEHLTSTGQDERIERPATEAVPLFWRFVFEKFGLLPPAH